VPKHEELKITQPPPIEHDEEVWWPQ
jgi:hypothetical protein